MNKKNIIVDVWANWWPKDFFERSVEFKKIYKRLKMQDRMRISIESMELEAKKGSVDKIIISATAFDNSPVTNKVIYEVLKTRKDLFVGCASVNPLAGMSAIRELKNTIIDYDFRALKIIPFLYDLPPNHAVYYPLYSVCIEYDIPVLILTGHTAIAKPNSTGHPSFLDEIALHFPELKIIAGHAGYPWTKELISLVWKHENVFIETSGHRPKHFSEDLIRFLKSYGKGKVLFGTGYPMMNYFDPIMEIQNLNLSKEVEANYLGMNALRIWPNLLV